jgi:hypothetical protein
VTGNVYCGAKVGQADLLMRGIGARLCLCRKRVAMRLLSATTGCEDSERERNRGVTGITLEDRVPLSRRAHSIGYLLWMSGSRLQASSA